MEKLNECVVLSLETYHDLLLMKKELEEKTKLMKNELEEKTNILIESNDLVNDLSSKCIDIVCHIIDDNAFYNFNRLLDKIKDDDKNMIEWHRNEIKNEIIRFNIDQTLFDLALSKMINERKE